MRTTSSPTRLYLVIACLAFVPILCCLLGDANPTDVNSPYSFCADHLVESADDPVLSTPGLNATFGYANLTAFNFTITYQSSSNATPSYVNLTVIHENWTASHAMLQVPPGGSNYSAGVLYHTTITLPTIGNYSHYFTTSNGSGIARLPAVGALTGPSIAALRNYTKTEVAFQWFNSTTAVEPDDPTNRLMYDIPLDFDFTMYGKSFNVVQVSHYGFLRFQVFPWSLTNREEIDLPTSNPLGAFSAVACPQEVWVNFFEGQSDLRILRASNYTLIQQRLVLTYQDSQTKLYNGSFQYVLFRNGSIMLNYEYIKVNFGLSETVGVNFGDNSYFSPFTFSNNVTQKSFYFTYNFIATPRILNFSLSPSSGTQVTVFNFTLDYQDVENNGPYEIFLELNGINYTMTGENASDHNIMDGKLYARVFQFLQPSVAYAHKFHVLGPTGWWHSPVINLPTVIYVNTYSPTIENFTMDPTQGWINYTNITIRFTYKDLDNDSPANLSVVFDASGSLYVLHPIKEMGTDAVTFDGCAYKVDLRCTNTSFLYDASLKFYMFANDSFFTTRYPASGGEWLDGPNFILPFNYSVSRLLHFEYSIDSPTEIYPWATVSVNLPFNFSYYGLPYSKVVFSQYGFLRFTTNTATTLPVPGSTDQTSILSLNMLNNNLSFNSYYTYIFYEMYSDKAVFYWKDVISSGYYSRFMIILHQDGRIVFSVLKLNAGTSGGINLGDGTHYTGLPLTQAQLPLTNVSFMFIPPGTNLALSSSTINNTLFTTSQKVGITASYSSPTDVPVVGAYCLFEGKDFHGIALQLATSSLTFQSTGFVDYTTGAGFILVHTLPSGNYTVTIHLVDIYGTHFTPETFQVIVNNPPTITPIETPGLYGAVGRDLNIIFEYSDAEGIAPDYFLVRWDGNDYAFEPESMDFSKPVRFVWAITLTHGSHVFSVLVRDAIRDENHTQIDNHTINVKWLPVIEVLSFPPANVMVPGNFEVKVRITSNETGFELSYKYVRVNGMDPILLKIVSGEPDTYSASIPLVWGTYQIFIDVADGYNEVVYPAAGMITVTVINLPLILGLSIGVGGMIAIFLFVQSRKKKAQAAQQARLRRQVLAKKPTRRDIEESAEEKRKERQKELQEIDAIDVVQPATTPIKKSAAVKRATVGQAVGTGSTTTSTKSPKPAPSSSGQSKDKSGYSQNAVETGTPVNRTVLKEYIERQRKEGARELHFIKIKNDLNIISQKKSSKLYRILQELVKDEILVRKGSNYVIVG